MPLTKYQKIILEDVQHDLYEHRRRWSLRVFCTLTTIVFAGYAVSIYFVLYPFFGRLGSLISVYSYQDESRLNQIIYFHERFIYLFGLPLIVLVALFSGLLIYDIHQRNAVIRHLLKSWKPEENDTFDQKNN